MILKVKLAAFGVVCSVLNLTAVQVVDEGISPFENVYIYVFMLLGIFITLGRDIRDPKKKESITWKYLIWSLAISIGFSVLVAIAWEDNLIERFTTYLLIVFVSAFSPLIIDKYTDLWIDKTGEAVGKIPDIATDHFKNILGGGKDDKPYDHNDFKDDDFNEYKDGDL